MILNRICWLNYFVIWVEFLLNVSCNNCDLDKYLNFELNACKVQLQCVSCFNVVFEVKFISDIGQAILPIVCSFVFMFQEELKKYSNEVGTKGGARWYPGCAAAHPQTFETTLIFICWMHFTHPQF